MELFELVMSRRASASFLVSALQLKDPNSSIYKRNSFDGKRIMDGWLISPTSSEKQEFEAQLSNSVGFKREQQRKRFESPGELERRREFGRRELLEVNRHGSGKSEGESDHLAVNDRGDFWYLQVHLGLILLFQGSAWESSNHRKFTDTPVQQAVRSLRCFVFSFLLVRSLNIRRQA
eukprot:746016-Hanusia_phi.AAC.4